MRQLKQGIVIKSTGSRYKVLDSEGIIHDCVIKGKFRVKGIRTTNPVAVGDNVSFDLEDSIITALAPRRNYMIRRASNLSKESQIIAANIDQAFIMLSVKMPETPVEFIDRFLATAEAYRIPAALIINKSDLYGAEEQAFAEKLQSVYGSIGYETWIVSVEKNENLEPVLAALTGRTTLVAGNSGVGKSSFLNRLNPALNLKTAIISEYHEQGKHMTTFPEMHPLPGGGFVIDTPGIRGFGVIDFARDEIYHFFPEIFRISSRCRFHNCLHLNEPDCAVRSAVAVSEIEPWRYRSYISMLLEDTSKYR
ncbi:MAG TPA: ribosome small subunit-dependent GTPase A [Bacteroidales bacterium]|nr:ribosome small subunit-dependent GTPase A [Bacteroidales bacterium]